MSQILIERLLEKRDEIEENADHIMLWELQSALDQEMRRVRGDEAGNKPAYKHNPEDEERKVYGTINDIIKESKTFEEAINMMREDIEHYQDLEKDETLEVPDKLPYHNKPSLYRNILSQTFENLENNQRNHKYLETVSKINEIQEKQPEELKTAIRETNNLEPLQQEFLRQLQQITTQETQKRSIRQHYEESIDYEPLHVTEYNQAIDKIYQQIKQV